MATRRVVVYFQHEREEALTRSLLPNAEFSPSSLAVGEADDAQIASLRAAGVTVSIVESEPTLTPGNSPGMHLLADTRLDELPFQFPDRFKVRTKPGPLLPQWRERLQSGSRIEERLGPHAWLVYVPRASELDRIQALEFVTDVEPYRALDTGPVSPLARPSAKSLAPDGVEGVPSGVFDVRIHRNEDLQAVRLELERLGALVIGTGQEKVRVRATSSIAAQMAGLREVAAVEAWQPPHLLCARARALTRADAPALLGGGALTGKGEIIAIADTGVDGTHDAFHGRTVMAIDRARVGLTDDPHGHGTHVAAIAAGGERLGQSFKGIAPEADLIVHSLLDAKEELSLPVDLRDLLLEVWNLNARIHNDSWGADTHGAYASSCREIDSFIWDHEEMLVVVAAGNEGTCVCPPHKVRQSPVGFVDYWSVGAPATSKNALVVGACRSDRTSGGNAALTYGAHWPDRFGEQPIAMETNSGNPECIAAFSSRGPTTLSRAKPDVVAPGTDILSAAAATAPAWRFDGFAAGTNKKYGYLSGTSMAAPVVAGIAALVREWLRLVRGDATPTAALLKAVIIGGARPLTGADANEGNPNGLPTWHQGYGRVDLAGSVPLDGSFKLAYLDYRRSHAEAFQEGGGPRRRYTVEVTAPCTLTVVLAYADAPADGPQNCLNLVVEPPAGPAHWGNETLPNHLPRPDAINNVELVRFAAQPGTHVIIVKASLLAEAPQGFALVVTGQLLTEQFTPYR